MDIIKTFKSPAEYLEWATKAPCQWKGVLSSRSEGGRDWAGTDTYDEAYNLAKYGWVDGLKVLKQRVEIAMELGVQVPNAIKRYDIAGGYPDPVRAAAGDVFCMVSKGKDFKHKPVVKIRVDSSFSAEVDVDRVMKWGGAICSYVNQLEMMGFSTQLDWFEESFQNETKVSFGFPLKRAGEQLSLLDAVFWLAHPSSVRRISFSAMERLDVEADFSYGYGRPSVVTKPEKDVLHLTINDARDSVERNLERICDKHQKILQNDPESALGQILSGQNLD
ncbi:MAG: DUF7192 family protein [Alphaproteobacteria bacterium]